MDSKKLVIAVSALASIGVLSYLFYTREENYVFIPTEARHSVNRTYKESEESQESNHPVYSRTPQRALDHASQ